MTGRNRDLTFKTSHATVGAQAPRSAPPAAAPQSGQVIGIDVKAASTVGPDDFRGLRRIADRLGDDFLTGVVLYTGTSTLPFGDKLRAMPVSALWQLPAPVETDLDPSAGRTRGGPAVRQARYLIDAPGPR